MASTMGLCRAVGNFGYRLWLTAGYSEPRVRLHAQSETPETVTTAIAGSWVLSTRMLIVAYDSMRTACTTQHLEQYLTSKSPVRSTQIRSMVQYLPQRRQRSMSYVVARNMTTTRTLLRLAATVRNPKSPPSKLVWDRVRLQAVGLGSFMKDNSLRPGISRSEQTETSPARILITSLVLERTVQQHLSIGTRWHPLQA